jgi:hypothetical protein
MLAEQQWKKIAQRREAPEGYRKEHGALAGQNSQSEIELFERARPAKHRLAHHDGDFAVGQRALVYPLNLGRSAQPREQFDRLAKLREQSHRLPVRRAGLLEMRSGKHHRAVHAGRNLLVEIAIQEFNADGR